MSSNQINQLEALVKKQGEQIERLHDTIYYLLADIYPLQKEGNYIKIYSVYNHMKYDKFCNTRWLLDEDDDGSDEYNAFAENRSKEATRRAQEEYDGEIDDEDLSTSTHSSMPPLEKVEISVSEDEYEDEDDDMPSLISVSSKEEPDYYKLPPSSDEESNSSSSNSVSKRMRYSAELCGNN
jgi:hypothetical protein